ncbi:MAG: tRNA (adenosine(37)-N6)-threonylcarbamoyltransferase complex ATPase subunit type 1 TsaE [Rhodocyclaceae bacterium]|nr:tRNA (adenosine(37)-N6)-threonylcarbamoyltransferase complex ATPase subunit type 1 TsaE [Rhodocyclaceae bacterium]MCA3091008.1 tRNA (adenosine(37)-N6)-threonylcarbamoyltransferase complex ATPase subunit type 1 TsaE [Rhodocyclaceae bacterium]MCA3095250.1 tRNA (adenosine(37)-N6)-threonylcarbamoyltransferase complex ATPase subunit type 1 TsaE [Rhodocyclaceae bacterium]MCA3099649.1 tRNA (adenosine(37)-N6)-threonylcarbamoyltransferase complex ATPase subunit type 1 TsaE [Rhodocyclaceae bacterium]M
MPSTLTRVLADEAATAALGAALAPLLAPGLSIHLCGPLGAGKTTLVRTLLRTLGERGRVRSPTFTLVEPYRAGGLELAHLDLYRFENAAEWSDAGFDEYLGGDTVSLIEWPERAAPLLPPPDLRIDIAVEGDARRATLTAHGARGDALLTALQVRGTATEPPA